MLNHILINPSPAHAINQAIYDIISSITASFMVHNARFYWFPSGKMTYIARQTVLRSIFYVHDVQWFDNRYSQHKLCTIPNRPWCCIETIQYSNMSLGGNCDYSDTDPMVYDKEEVRIKILWKQGHKIVKTLRQMKASYLHNKIAPYN